jgi:hypothetical protein
VTGCFGKKVLLEPTPMRVAGRELVVNPVEGCTRVATEPADLTKD